MFNSKEQREEWVSRVVHEAMNKAMAAVKRSLDEQWAEIRMQTCKKSGDGKLASSQPERVRKEMITEILEEKEEVLEEIEEREGNMHKNAKSVLNGNLDLMEREIFLGCYVQKGHTVKSGGGKNLGEKGSDRGGFFNENDGVLLIQGDVKGRPPREGMEHGRDEGLGGWFDNFVSGGVHDCKGGDVEGESSRRVFDRGGAGGSGSGGGPGVTVRYNYELGNKSDGLKYIGGDYRDALSSNYTGGGGSVKGGRSSYETTRCGGGNMEGEGLEKRRCGGGHKGCIGSTHGGKVRWPSSSRSKLTDYLTGSEYGIRGCRSPIEVLGDCGGVTGGVNVDIQMEEYGGSFMEYSSSWKHILEFQGF